MAGQSGKFSSWPDVHIFVHIILSMLGEGLGLIGVCMPMLGHSVSQNGISIENRISAVLNNPNLKSAELLDDREPK